MGKLILCGMLVLGFFNPALADSYLVLENEVNHVLLSGSVTRVYGCQGENNITLESTARAELLNFVGNNIVTVRSDSNLFTVSRSGAAVTFAGTDGTKFVIPATTSSQTIAFDDGKWRLVIDAGRVMLGDQEVVAAATGLLKAAYTLSGTVRASGHAAVDGDVNDPSADYTANDTIAQAQSLSKPAIVGGYLNTPGTGEQGRSYLGGDEVDYYQASLFAGDTIYLSIADYQTTDLDLYLFNAATENLVDASLGFRNFESLTISEDGIYAIAVHAYGGASNYVLSIGGSSEGGLASPLRLSDPFVPGDVMVSFKEAETGAKRAFSLPKTPGLQYAAGGIQREMLMTLEDDHQKKGVFQAMEAGDDTISRKLDTLLAIKELRKRGDVDHADPNYILQGFASPNDSLYPYQWHYPLINLPAAWDITQGSSSVVVAVLDTGVLLDHPDLKDNLTHDGVSGDGFDFIQDATAARDGNGIDSNPYDTGDLGNGGGSSSFHGTHVAGTVAGVGNNAKGIAGVAWTARIMPVRVLGKGGGTSYDILQGVRYAAGLPNDSNTTPSQKADVINLSLGGPSYSGTAQSVYAQARAAGVIVVAAAGNEDSSEPSYPASYNGVVSVSAVDLNSSRAFYSNYGQYVDVAAPGGDTTRDLNGDGRPDGVLSTLGNLDSGALAPSYQYYQGTSMAAPHVAGVAALMKSVNTGLTPDGFDLSLQRSEIVNDLGETGRDDYYGYGLIDAFKAVQVAQGGMGTQTSLQVRPETLNLGWSGKSAALTLSKTGTDPLTITSVTDDVDWLSVTELSVEGGLGTYTITVDRSGLGNGSYRGDVTFVSTENTVTVAVRMQVNTSPVAGDAGYHYMLLLAADTLDLVQQKSSGSVDGVYAYAFTEVPGGMTYKICAGTDFDNDGFVGDPGESFGMYRTLDQPDEITADGDVTDLDFTTEYLLNIPDNASIFRE